MSKNYNIINLISNNDVGLVENDLYELKKYGILSYKLCGAGAGGYFLTVTDKKYKMLLKTKDIEINVDSRGLKLWELN